VLKGYGIERVSDLVESAWRELDATPGSRKA